MTNDLRRVIQNYCAYFSGTPYLSASELMRQYDGLIVIDAQQGFYDQMLALISTNEKTLAGELFDFALRRSGDIYMAARRAGKPRCIVEYRGYGDTDLGVHLGERNVCYVRKRDNDGGGETAFGLRKFLGPDAKKMRWLAEGMYLDQCVHDTVATLLHQKKWNVDVCLSASSINMFGITGARGSWARNKWWKIKPSDINLDQLNFAQGTKCVLKDLKGHLVA